jgi:type IV pilus assembly protein PilQ
MIHSRKFLLACSCLLLPVGIMAESSARAAAPVPATPAPTAAATPEAAPLPSAAPDATPGPLDPNAPAPIAPPAPGQPATINGQAPAAPIDPGAAAANPGAARAREFQGDEVGQVLRLLARQAKISLVVSSQVAGTVNMRLEDVTAMQAIQVICQAQNYDLSQANGVYYVKTSAEKAAEPTEGDFYTFSYARAAQVVPLLTSQMKSKATPPQVDERTNTVFYQEAKSNLANIRELLARVDRPTRQVMIEARLVEVTANPQQSYGINWGGVVGSAASPKTFKYGGSGLASSTVTSSTNPTTGQVTNVIQPSTLPTVTTNTDGTLNPVDFIRSGATAGSGFLSNLGNQFAILDIPSMSATLRFLNEDQDSEFLANPRIVTADNLEATIKITRNQPVPQLNFNEQTATAVFGGFQDKTYGNTLVVKPSINKDNFVTLSVKPEISNHVGDSVFNFAGASVSSPIIDTRQLEANVLIKSGCTLAIGGLLQDETTRGTTKVPVLGDIPIFGYLFQEHLNSRTKRNLLIFVTPTIINQDFGTGLEDQITGLKNSSTHNEYANPHGWRNNAEGALRLIKTSEKQIAADYPAPGDCNPNVSFKQTVTPKGD